MSISTISLTFFFGLSGPLIHLVRDEHKVALHIESEMTQLDEYDEQAS